MLKRQPATEHIPVLAYALDPDHDQGELLELNYLHKPLRADRLAEELGRYFRPEASERVVLVVDDDPGILEMHSRLVGEAGCRAITSRNGREALEVLEHTRPDLILLDLMMPEMDGFAFVAEFRRHEPWRAVPIVVITAKDLSREDRERLNGYVEKILQKGAYGREQLLAEVRELVAQSVARRRPKA
jgi:hypothetical protein